MFGGQQRRQAERELHFLRVRFRQLIPAALRLQQQFHHFAHCALAARGLRDVMRQGLHFGPRVGGKANGRNGVEVFKAAGVSVENLTACNFLSGSGGGGRGGKMPRMSGGALAKEVAQLRPGTLVEARAAALPGAGGVRPGTEVLARF